jgi:hypothetical protein
MMQIITKILILGLLFISLTGISLLLPGCVIRPVENNTPTGSPAPVVYYVAKSGSDKNPGTETQPWLTIQKAAETMQPGETVLVRSGTYYESIRPARSGKSGAYITYKEYPGDAVIIDGAGVNVKGWGLFGISQKQYIIVDGFEITNAGGPRMVYPGVMINPGSGNIILRNLTIHNCANSGILVNGDYSFPATTFINDITIDNCDIYHNNVYWGQESISLISVDGFEIKNTRVYDSQGTLGGRDEVVEGIDCKEGTKNGSIHDCEVYNTLIGIYIDSGKTPQYNISIYNNKLHDNYFEGIVLAAEGGADLNNVSIYNNLIYNNRDRGFIVENYNFNVSFSFTNNTLYHNTNAEIAIYNPDARTIGVIRNNIVCANAKYSFLLAYNLHGTNTAIDQNLFYNAYEYDGQPNALGVDYKISDPLFVNAEDLDFRLQNKSPAIDAGSAIGAPGKDYDGAVRPQGKGYDIGAYEYPSPTPTPESSPLAAPSSTLTPGSK